jgi:hypothetical protein
MQLLRAKSDLALLAILASGNDYLPAMKGAAKLEQLWARWAYVSGFDGLPVCDLGMLQPRASRCVCCCGLA